MAGAPRVRSMNAGDIEARPVLVPAGNKARLVTRKPVSKPPPKVEPKKLQIPVPAVDSPPSSPALSPPALLRRHELLLHSNLSMNASCSSDASTESFCSRASTGRIGRMGFTGRRRQSVLRAEKIGAKPEKIVPDGVVMGSPEVSPGRRRCAWVTPNTDPCYVAFHDEEWGVPVHDDKKLFELLVFSSALSELTWPTILSKRQSFREVFMDFNPDAVAKLNEKKIIAPGSAASFLLSEPKLRAVIENSRQILKIAEEFGSFSKYCWSFVNNKPITSRFRYPRQVLVKSPKADVISKDLVRRGFRCVGPTVVYSFMQAAGLTNDHLISCFRFTECAAGVTTSVTPTGVNEGDRVDIDQKVVLEKMDVCEDVAMCIDLQL
ncbi:Methyladenine glycosylase protein [Dioscorea alata]|uniref:Methyladenine glycosylase protein n=1 Tax=Dioscorea alata TaxID=55571 RepID=A0ACB7VLI7_DIOAL|nr:Methyladenine glycosylase protein [Dioscorea alata]